MRATKSLSCRLCSSRPTSLQKFARTSQRSLLRNRRKKAVDLMYRPVSIMYCSCTMRSLYHALLMFVPGSHVQLGSRVYVFMALALQSRLWPRRRLNLNTTTGIHTGHSRGSASPVPSTLLNVKTSSSPPTTSKMVNIPKYVTVIVEVMSEF